MDERTMSLHIEKMARKAEFEAITTSEDATFLAAQLVLAREEKQAGDDSRYNALLKRNIELEAQYDADNTVHTPAIEETALYKGMPTNKHEQAILNKQLFEKLNKNIDNKKLGEDESPLTKEEYEATREQFRALAARIRNDEAASTKLVRGKESAAMAFEEARIAVNRVGNYDVPREEREALRTQASANFSMASEGLNKASKDLESFEETYSNYPEHLIA